MCHEHLEPADDLGQWQSVVALLPVLDSLLRVDDDHEVLVLALVVALDLSIVAAHCDGFEGYRWSWKVL